MHMTQSGGQRNKTQQVLCNVTTIKKCDEFEKGFIAIITLPFIYYIKWDKTAGDAFATSSFMCLAKQ